MNAPHRIFQDATFDCDVLIVGSGAGGACVADILTAAGYDVLMLEEGPYRDAESAPTSATDAFTELWRGGGLLAALGPTPVAYAEGRCVGGGTEINSAIFQPTPDALLDSWAKRYRIDEFGAEQLVAYYQSAQQIVNASPPPPDPGAPSDVLKRGGEAMNWQVTPLNRGVKTCVGTNFCSFACPTGAKQSMTSTLIPKALARGLRLIARCRVRHLMRKGGTITGAAATATDARGGHHRIRVRANHVFVCAGAVHTPALLRRSGISRHVGNTLRLHPTIKVTARFDEEVNAHAASLPLYAITEFMPDRRLGGSVVQPGLFGMSLADDWVARKGLLPHWRHCGQYYAMVRAEGTGKVRPIWRASEPIVRYRLAEQDWRQLALGLEELALVMFAAGARQVYPSIADHPGWSSIAEVQGQARDQLRRDSASLMTIHLFSSMPPGDDPALTATDSFGRVRDVENLIIADASQIPEAPGVNPQATIMAMALRNAEAFLAREAAAGRRAAFAERCAA